MYNDYYLLKRIEDEEGSVAFATAMDSFAYKGEVMKSPFYYQRHSSEDVRPKEGDKVMFLKGSGEDVGDGLKAVKFEDLIMPI